jgi:hypothetical protein
MNFVARILIVWVSITAGGEMTAQTRSQQISPPVLIQVGRGLTVGTPFVIQLKNNLAGPISFCADFGKSVRTESGQQVAPNPFEVQKWNDRRWDTQLIGTDVGSGNTAVSIGAHESRSFRLQIGASGRYRLRLRYLEGESETQCPVPSEHAITTHSKPFSMQALAQK